MTNLATLIGANNLETLINKPENTFVVIEDNNGYEYEPNNLNIDFSKVVGIGSKIDCRRICHYLDLQKLANS